MKFIEIWQEQNNDNPELYPELAEEELLEKYKLPYIDHDGHCPRSKSHNSQAVDRTGQIRCMHKEDKFYKPSFMENYLSFDQHSKMLRREFYEPFLETDEDQALWDQEKETERVVDLCYAIISEKEKLLPFETILQRLNLDPEFHIVRCGEIAEPCKRVDELEKEDRESAEIFCPGHQEKNMHVVFPFDGLAVTDYLQRWKLQGEAPWYKEKVA